MHQRTTDTHSMAIISDFIAKSFNVDDKITILQTKAQILAARAADISSELDMTDLLHVGKKRRREVDLWLRNVRLKQSEVESICEDVKKPRLLLPTMDVGNRIGRLSMDIEDLMRQGEFRNGLTLDNFDSTRVPLVTSNPVGQTFAQNIKTILTWLQDDGVCRIGVYGMGGVGKSALLMHVHNELLDRRVFGDVYWVTATENTTELQNKIAKAVGLGLPNDDDPRRRAATLSSRLSRIGRIVLILDDMWQHFPLEELGVPLSSRHCKIVITTRSFDVCNRMACQEILKVEPLPEGDAWRLFLCHLGKRNAFPPEFLKIAKLIVKECGGLPLAIMTMSRSMRGVIDFDEWNNALHELRKPLRGQDDMKNDVFPVLKFSYHHLNDVVLQTCFLSCVLFPEDQKILRQELIDLWISEGILDEAETDEDQFHKGNTIVNRLENSCLLEASTSTGGERCVRLHDLMRDMAINITKSSPRFMVYPRSNLNEVPLEREWPEDVEKVSLTHNHISEISPGLSPRCPNLSALLLQCNPLESISDSFFTYMTGLKILNLSFTSLTRLPDTVSELKNLSTLLLNGCWNLAYVPSLGKLQKLQELGLRHTRIKDAPDGLDRLTNLRRLDVSQIKDVSVSFIRVLPRLYSLRVVKLSQPLKGKHLTGLRHLEKIHCRTVFDVNEWEKFVESRHHWKLKCYNFHLRGTKWRFGDRSAAPSRLSSGSDRIVSVSRRRLNGGKTGITLPKNMQFLGINDCEFRGTGLIDGLPSLQTTTELRGCEIRNCEGLNHLWYSSPLLLPPPVSTPLRTFSHFQKLHISSCPNMTRLFPVALLQQQLLPNLQQIELVNCPNMTEIISGHEENDRNVGNKTDLVLLPKLKTLTLRNLPVLESVCRGLLLCSSLINFSKEGCSRLRMIPLSLPLLCDSSDSTLRCLPLDIEWWTTLDEKYPKDVQLLRHALVKHSGLTSVL